MLCEAALVDFAAYQAFYRLVVEWDLLKAPLGKTGVAALSLDAAARPLNRGGTETAAGVDFALLGAGGFEGLLGVVAPPRFAIVA